LNKKIIGIFIFTLLILTNLTAYASNNKITKQDTQIIQTKLSKDFLNLKYRNIENRLLIDIPSSLDWRDVNGEDWTTPIKDQLQDICGSCWAFGALGGLEAMIKIWVNNSELEVDLSEQYMVSCSPGDCGGWYWMNTIRWIKYNGAIPESCFPYQADDTIPCEEKCPDWNDYLIGIDDYRKTASNITIIQNALVQYGPLPASMTVYEDFYPDFDGGVYLYEYGDEVFGHCITIVGYNNNWGGEDEGYWICKNSWGTEWGEDGWFRIAYGECDIEKGVYYLTGPNYSPDKPGKPSGTTSGKPGEEKTYFTNTSDVNSDRIKYCFDWGDGNQTWTSFFESGETVSANYTWEKRGNYDIIVKGEDEHGLESEWSEPLTVTMSKVKIFNQIPRTLLWLFELFPFLQP